jgi:hypothetical protein
MSLLERIDAAAGEQEIERGKQLIRAGGDRSASASDWLTLWLNRAGLRAALPFSGGGRRKVRLLTVPKDPIAGDKAANLKLSNARAAAVAAWLTGKGIDGARVSVAGLGDTQPVADNASEDGRARNRRVVLVKQ